MATFSDVCYEKFALFASAIPNPWKQILGGCTTREDAILRAVVDNTAYYTPIYSTIQKIALVVGAIGLVESLRVVDYIRARRFLVASMISATVFLWATSQVQTLYDTQAAALQAYKDCNWGRLPEAYAHLAP